MIRVLVVDDQEMIRRGLRAILEAQEGIELVGDAGDGHTALRLLEVEPVDVVLLDLRMPGMDGVELTRRIRRSERASGARIIVLTTFDQDENVLAALRLGANGFLGKGVTPAELLAAIREVDAGGGALSARAARALIDHVSSARPPVADPVLAERFRALTPREHAVVAQIARGLSNAEIAAAMVVSPYTVKTHANRAMSKVGARDRAQLVAFVHRSGLESLLGGEEG